MSFSDSIKMISSIDTPSNEIELQTVLTSEEAEYVSGLFTGPVLYSNVYHYNDNVYRIDDGPPMTKENKMIFPLQYGFKLAVCNEKVLDKAPLAKTSQRVRSRQIMNLPGGGEASLTTEGSESRLEIEFSNFESMITWLPDIVYWVPFRFTSWRNMVMPATLTRDIDFKNYLVTDKTDGVRVRVDIVNGYAIMSYRQPFKFDICKTEAPDGSFDAELLGNCLYVFDLFAINGVHCGKWPMLSKVKLMEAYREKRIGALFLLVKQFYPSVADMPLLGPEGLIFVPKLFNGQTFKFKYQHTIDVLLTQGKAFADHSVFVCNISYPIEAEGSISECMYNFSQQTWEFLKIRHDLETPNKIRTISSIQKALQYKLPF